VNCGVDRFWVASKIFVDTQSLFLSQHSGLVHWFDLLSEIYYLELDF